MEQQLFANESAVASPASRSVLFVDLDGTLLKCDLVHKALLGLTKSSPWSMVASGLALRSGRAALKRALTLSKELDVAHLPFREEVLDLVCAVRSQGNRVVLATAADERWAQQIASELGLFDDVLASDGSRNLKGQVKLDAIRDYCRRHGFAEFDYVGDSHADLPIWAEAKKAYVASPSFWLTVTLRRRAGATTILGQRTRLFELAKSLRVHQWSKNLLAFVPPITAKNRITHGVAVANDRSRSFGVPVITGASTETTAFTYKTMRRNTTDCKGTGIR